jgi:CelD/BcsL family acetyltransferase involved in cellulose biosynthesis/sterol desaturase/sphingolipid hydroxylase (fatty acid hydroxylase superfamily)
MSALATVWEAVAARLTVPNLVALGLLFATVLGASVAMFIAAHPGQRDPRAWLRYAFPREVLSHPSARADFLFWITRRLVMPLLMLPPTAAVIALVGWGVHEALSALPGLGGIEPGPAGPWTIVAFTVSALIAYDLSYYLYHFAQHRFPFMWELHKVHHSAEVLVGITKDRVHPLDEAMNRLWDGLVVGTLYGVWLLVAVDPVEATILGVNVYVLRNILMMDVVRHTHLKVSFGPLNAVVLPPHWHQLHHSTDPRHYDRNFGLMFSVWDRLFGTLAVPRPGESFTFGLGEREGREYQSLYGLYVLPVRRMVAVLLGRAPAPPDPAGPRIEIRRDAAALDAIAPAWAALERAARPGLFQSQDWLAAWWREAGRTGGFHPHLVLAWEGEALVGVLPLVTRRRCGLRVLQWMAKDVSDYCDAILAPGRADLLEPMWRAARAEGGHDIAWLSHLRPGAAAVRLARPGTRLSRSDRRGVATGLTLGPRPDPAALFQALGKKGRNNHRRGLRILAEAGPAGVRLAAPEEVPEALRRLAALKRAWLEGRGSDAPLFAEDGALLAALAECMARRGTLRLFVLEAGGHTAATLLCFVEGQALRAWLTAYDPALGRASPGTILLVEAALWASREGLAELDFLCGDEAYKAQLADRREELAALVGARTPLGHLALACDGALRRLRAPRGVAPAAPAETAPFPAATRTEA